MHVTIQYPMLVGLWDSNSQVLTQPTQTFEETSLSGSFIVTDIVQKQSPTEYKAVTLQNVSHNLVKEESHETLSFHGMAQSCANLSAISISVGLETK